MRDQWDPSFGSKKKFLPFWTWERGLFAELGIGDLKGLVEILLKIEAALFSDHKASVKFLFSARIRTRGLG